MAKASRVAARQAVALEDVQATLARLVEQVEELKREIAKLSKPAARSKADEK